MTGAHSPTRSVLFVVYDGFLLLDLAGPMEVLAGANLWSEWKGHAHPTYHLQVATRGQAEVSCSAGVALRASETLPDPESVDTVIVVGGPATSRLRGDAALLDWLAQAASRSRRVASICNAAFLLAEAGVLDGREATTHWAVCDKLRQRYPRVKVRPDEIFVRDGSIWTSAGVSAGMDLALALVEEDLGREAAMTIARWLVLFLKRPGGQSQFSAQLELQAAESDPLRAVQTWIVDHLAEDLSVSRLAEEAGMSQRNFSRKFKEEVGLTPGRYVQQVRLEAARRLLESTGLGVRAIAGRSGLGSEETLRRIFLAEVGVTPTEYRSRFSNATAKAPHPSPHPDQQAKEPR